MKLVPHGHSLAKKAFTLAEVVISICIAALALGGIVSGYILSSDRAEWSAYSLAANSLAMQRVEQARACKWDPLGYPPVDKLVTTNFPTTVDVLDIPISLTNKVYGTTYTSITIVRADPPLKLIRVDCVWPYRGRGIFTNTVLTYRAADQ